MNQLLASLMFFTRLPWWRLKTVPTAAFEHVADWWPLMGWLTGGTMAVVFLVASLLGFGSLVTALLTVVSRLLLTGALHEDGLADFFDGFGGGTSREHTLLIMKDSHIGTYGVLGLMVCVGLLVAFLAELSSSLAGAVLILLFDVSAKCAASFITGQLPYARTAESAKNGVVYVGRSPRGWMLHLLRCALALALPVALCFVVGVTDVLLLLPVPFFVEYLLMCWMRRRLGGYTGDCCGALFLLSELSLYLTLYILY